MKRHSLSAIACAGAHKVSWEPTQLRVLLACSSARGLQESGELRGAKLRALQGRIRNTRHVHSWSSNNMCYKVLATHYKADEVAACRMWLVCPPRTAVAFEA